MSKYRGRIVRILYCFLSQFFTTTYGMEAVSLQSFSLHSLGSLYVLLKEGVSVVKEEQKKQKRSLKKMREEQRYMLLILAEMQRDQRDVDKEIKKLERKITRRTYEILLQLRILDCNVRQGFEQVDAQISRLFLGKHGQKEDESARSSVLFESSSDDDDWEKKRSRFVPASSSSTDSYGKLL